MENFAHPIIEAIESSTNLPKPRCYCKKGKYSIMLKRMNNSGLLTWRLDEMRQTDLSNYASTLELTNFAIRKDANYERLISWPRITNLYAKISLSPELPDPSLFQLTRADDIKKSAIYLDVSNMFHNMGPPILMTDLFPFPLIKFGELEDMKKQDVLDTVGTPSLHEDSLIRPAQVTMPMGFIWAVCLAHNATTNIIKQAYTITKPLRGATNSKSNLVYFNKKEAHFQITHGTALVLSIIDDVGIMFAGWTARNMVALHAELVRLLTEAGLPIAPDKSLKVGEIHCEVNV